MGFFSWNCTKCGHSIMSPYAVHGDEMWLNECVALFPDGARYKGSYDGYGRVGGAEVDYGVDVEFQHIRCWEEAGKPDYEQNSPDAGGQGHFYDDGNPPERTWRDALAEGDPDFLAVAAENAQEREREG